MVLSQLSCFCGPCYSVFCMLMSGMGCVYLLLLGSLVKKNYPYLGEWTTHGEDAPSLSDQMAEASSACYTTAGIYGGFFIASLLGVLYNRHTRRL